MTFIHQSITANPIHDDHRDCHQIPFSSPSFESYPVLFLTNRDDPLDVNLVTGWASVAGHEAWIRGGAQSGATPRVRAVRRYAKDQDGLSGREL